VKIRVSRACSRVFRAQGTAYFFPAWQIGTGLNGIVLGLAVALALLAGWTDWRSRRIPNWLTVPGFLIGVSANVLIGGWAGLKTSLLGAGLGLLVLLPFVFLRSLGAGDWKLAGALGAFVGWEVLVNLLMGSVLMAGVMALGLVIYKRRFKQTVRNIGRLLASMFTFRMPGAEVSLDNPHSLKVPYGVALALTTLLFGIGKMWGARWQ
jgi:prepilin peptidase CpaA